MALLTINRTLRLVLRLPQPGPCVHREEETPDKDSDPDRGQLEDDGDVGEPTLDVVLR